MAAGSQGSNTYRKLVTLIGQHLGRLIAETVVEKGCRSSHVQAESLDATQLRLVLPELERGIRLFSRGDAQRRACIAALRALDGSGKATGPAEVLVERESDVVNARQQARWVAQDIGFGHIEQVRIATVVSELARNALMYAGSGVVRIARVSVPRLGVIITVEDHGPGIADLETVLAGDYQSRSGMGMGLVGSKRLMDEIEIDSRPGHGTRITAILYKNPASARSA